MLPAVVAAYLTARAADGVKLSTLRQARSAIAAAHVRSGLDNPAASIGVKTVMAGLTRRLGMAQKQADPLRHEDTWRRSAPPPLAAAAGPAGAWSRPRPPSGAGGWTWP